MIKKSEKIGVYICYCGGNISDHVDVEQVRAEAEKLPGVTVARTNSFMCSDPGQALIIEDLHSGLVDRVVVASCAPSLHESTFRSAISRAGANPYIYDHANIREHVSWVLHGERATRKAEKLVAAAVGKAGLLEPLEPIRVEARKHATVIGGGVAGLKAAVMLAARGLTVTLIEKTAYLGGNAARLERLAPTGEKSADVVNALASAAMSDNRITILGNTELTGFGGYVGNFSLKLQTSPAVAEPGEMDHETLVPCRSCPAESPTEHTLETGAIVLATGFRHYQPRRGEYGHGEHAGVITLPELIRHLGQGTSSAGMLELDGKKIRSLAMIHCVGSRQIPGIHEEGEDGRLNEHCSRTCCSAALFLANSIRERFPATHIYDFYRDIRTYGRGQEELYRQAAGNHVVFLRFSAEDAPVVAAGDGEYPLRVTVRDALTFNEEVEVPVDLVVLVTGMEAGAIGDLVSLMKLPLGADGFLQEVHPKLAPVETAVAGIFLAGTCQAPMTVGEAANGAAAAAVKVAGLLGKGYVELDPYVAAVDEGLCTGCGECLSACLGDGALEMVEVAGGQGTVRTARVVPALCLGCGACVAVCPVEAIDLKGWSLKQYEAMVDMIVADTGAAEGGGHE